MELEQRVRGGLSPEWELVTFERPAKTRVLACLRRSNEYLPINVDIGTAKSYAIEDRLYTQIFEQVRLYERDRAGAHPVRIESYDGDLKGLARDVAGLRYDALQEFLKALSDELGADRVADQAKGREKLAQALYSAEVAMATAHLAISSAWMICEPFELEPE